MTSSLGRQLATFFGVLLLLYAAGFAAGHIIDAEPPAGGHGMGADEDAHGAHGEPSHGQEPARHAQKAEAHGLSSTENGLRLAVDASEMRAGRRHDIAFSVLDETGAPVTEYDTTHTKKMHMILVRRDTTGFQHLHPAQDEAGVWHARTKIAEPGTYRLYADFSHDGEKTTLAGDIEVDGPFEPRPLPEPEPLARTDDGYTVRIDARSTTAGQESTIGFTVLKDGREVQPEPYLGARGHLVALREGDLAFLHVHPTAEPGGAIAYETAFPSAGKYRLFLQFKHDGRVQTAAFTHEVD